MIIVSQDKSEIINFDKVQDIYVSGRYISLNFELNNNEVVGTYETEERAKEILADIYSKINEGKTVYKMPKE